MARALSVDKSSSILWSEQQPRLVVSGLLISGVSRTMPPKLRGALMLGTAAVLCVVALSIYAEDKALDNVRSKRDDAQLKLDEFAAVTDMASAAASAAGVDAPAGIDGIKGMLKDNVEFWEDLIDPLTIGFTVAIIVATTLSVLCLPCTFWAYRKKVMDFRLGKSTFYVDHNM